MIAGQFLERRNSFPKKINTYFLDSLFEISSLILMAFS